MKMRKRKVKQWRCPLQSLFEGEWAKKMRRSRRKYIARRLAERQEYLRYAQIYLKDLTIL